jgi:glyoxylase I family protein
MDKNEKKHVTGFGGFFFRSAAPSELGRWYEEHFGINSMKSQEVWRQEQGPTVFAPFPQATEYFGASGQSFMINLRVEDLEGLLYKLSSAGVRIDENRHEDAIGKFAWVYDPEGNKIELWEPSAQSR